MKPFSVIDCETPPFRFGRTDLLPFLWGYYNGSEYHQFEETEKLVEFIRERDEVIYAHNGGRFDFHFLTDHFEPGRPIKLINGRIAKFKLGKCELRDSYNIIPAPLADFQKMEMDYSLFEAETRYLPANWKKITEYQKDDCVQLWHLVNAFINKHGMVLTQAGASMKYFRKLYGVEVKTDEYYFDHFKDFYYGGRVQCFQRGVIDNAFSVHDINSAYPFAMLERHAFGTKVISVKKPIDYAIKRPQAFFDITAISKGALPWREKVGAKLLFPNDETPRRYRVTGWEIRTALKWGALSGVTVHNVYDSTETIDFKDYIEPIYAARLEAKAAGDKAETLLLKLLMNSLYGKFGANPNEYTDARTFETGFYKRLTLGGIHWNKEGESEYADDPLYTFAGQLGRVLVGQRDLLPHEKHFYNVATAASITGNVRAYLFDAVMTCGLENVLYCDTDSIATTNGGGLPSGDALGCWKHEGDFIRAAIAGRKMYAFYPASGDPKTASKGAVLSADEILTLANGGNVTAQKDAPAFSVRMGQRYIQRKIVATG